MKKTIAPFVFGSCMLLLFQACTKNVKEPEANEPVDANTLGLIKAKGFSTSEVQKIEGGYLVEGDIVLTTDDLQTMPTSPNLVIASEEQYRTFNLVNTNGGRREITVSASGSVNAALSTAINNALARYNAQNLNITFRRVGSGGNINIRLVNTRQYIASAGFPSGGNPYNEVKYANAYANYPSGFMTTVIAHEIGHCIGFRHTDYMNRAYSCGGSASNEGSGTVGAVHIPGTPTAADPNSWMLACLGSNTDRPFNANDRTALGYIY
ncbi:Dual-action HEIGH metallo-peptidase [Cnuella takakiae]|uniref:Dual-action HEIGH metallo-peptidase n=1 Tax=Cnuella takakiae TaxID=1302690 RepID=A0A1M5FXC1_9BACT|nr:M57 family metalloprotease [Cnuella takakiae]OLY92241.1 hypothetical protein BUE76_10315 [Cnuella takakiae]SHF96034.1 Dual-action HEIGH metallo-peptidase [Cnuella takakiae]